MVYNGSMKLEVIVNPVAAAGRTLQVWRKLEAVLKEEKRPYHVHYSTLEHTITDICRELTTHLTQDADILIVGGDGSMNEAVNGICDLKHARLGFIPCGSGNDQIRDMDLTKDPLYVLQRFLEGKVRRRVDIGEVTYHITNDKIDRTQGTVDHALRKDIVTRRFNVSAGIGFDADVCHDVQESKLKPYFNKLHIGKLIYLFAALKYIFRNHCFAMSCQTAEGERKFSRVMFLAAMNHAYEGGGFKFAPDASYTDGMLDLCIAKDLGVFSFIRVFIHAWSGSHVKYAQYVEMIRTDCVRVETAEPLWVHTDGEVDRRSTDIELRILKDKLQLLV